MKEHYKGVGHIAIYTADTEQSIAFYEMIGGKVLMRSGKKREGGEVKLTMLEFAGWQLELVEPPAGELVPSGQGSIPHFSIWVDDIDAAAAALKAAGVTTFLTPEKNILPETFGGLENWFFSGPSGEEVELMKKL